MTTQLLATELANLIHESKRKHNDLRQAAERSLEELKALKNTSEQGAPEELSQQTSFVNPFIIACGTKNAKFTAIAIVCLQRLIVSRALPRSKLNQVLEALMQASSAGLDVQLKILQALPSLVQNYSEDLRGDLLVTALNICFTLQGSKNAIVNHTSAATLQQLVVSVFDKVVAEDKAGGDVPFAGVAPTGDGEVQLRPAALDACRIFNDLCLLTENQRPEFIRFQGLPQTFGLELIESVITNHASVFTSHPEQVHVLQVRAMPLITSALRGRPSFATSVRLVRILYTMLRRHLAVLPNECGDALDILTQLLDQDSAIWKRALCMEVFRGIFADHSLMRRIYAFYDARDGQRDVLKTLTATFVRLSTEKPAVIGLGHQSTIPTRSSQNGLNATPDQAMLEASGVTGIISTVGSEGAHTGISTQWSSVRVPCIDQLDKTEAPSIPESYIYSLILSCISSLSDGLAKFILPLTVPTETRIRRKTSKKEPVRASPAPETDERASKKDRLDRAASFKKNPVPINPLTQADHPMHREVKICSAIVDECWPAILATCSTFLYAALDSDYYHGLVRAFQRFAHVAGLLQLSTPRDAFITTLGKAAVPPNVFSACLSAGQHRGSTAGTMTEGTASSLVSQARGLLTTEGGAATHTEKNRVSIDAQSATLNTRNLLCLRALLNLGIALGPTLGPAWRIVLETLQQADFVLYASMKTPGRTPSFSRGQETSGDNEQNSLTANFGSEVRAVETAASRLMESTVDFPNEAFTEVVSAVCRLLQRQPDAKAEGNIKEDVQLQSPKQTLQAPMGQNRRVFSFSNKTPAGSTQEDQFSLAKLGDLASINMERLLAYPPEVSGWTLLTDELIKTLESFAIGPTVRTRAAEILTKLMLEASNMASSIPEDARGPIQLRILGVLNTSLLPLQADDRETSVASHATDIEIHRIVLDGLKSIIEGCGESLVSGWDLAFEIIGTVFTTTQSPGPDDRRGSVLFTRSSKLVRSSFSSLQLIASDFLASLPNSCFLILVDTLYKFSSQDDDLNIALTTVTFFWILSDFLSGKNESLDITEDIMKDGNASELAKLAADRSKRGSEPALWMLLLLRLTTVASDDRLDLRNSAIQTLLRIFDAYGNRLSPEAWSFCIKWAVLRLLSSLEEELKADNDEREQKEWNGTAVVVLDGISNLLGNYLGLLTQHSSFGDLWSQLLQHLSTMLGFKVFDINTATFKALGHLLSQTNAEGRPTLTKETIDLAWELWARSIPVSNTTGDNQACLIAYVNTLNEVYRLIEADLTVERAQRILDLLRTAVREESVGGYVSDMEQMTQLQAKVLGAVKMIRTDVKNVPSVVIKQVANLIELPFQSEGVKLDNKRTYIAMSKASMIMLEEIVLKHASDGEIYDSDGLSTALLALCRPISLKYRFKRVTKSIQPWKLATSTALAILKPTLSYLTTQEVGRDTSQRMWMTVVTIADGILGAECDAAVEGTDFASDEEFDMDSFKSLRQLIIPSLGAEDVQDGARKAYAEGLFKTSLIHTPAPEDEAIIEGVKLAEVYKARLGRTAFVGPTTRSRIAYVALDELFSLVSANFKTETSSTSPSATDRKLHVRIGRIAAPFLMLRSALPLRSYIADQPLRGLMPQPLSQRHELLWVLGRLVALRSEAEAIPELEGCESEERRHLLRLYPLIVKALGVGGDEEVMKLLRGALEAVGEELGF